MSIRYGLSPRSDQNCNLLAWQLIRRIKEEPDAATVEVVVCEAFERGFPTSGKSQREIAAVLGVETTDECLLL